MTQNAADNLGRYYERLLEDLGPQGWWPAETRLEVILGAILTQNTTWRNAALAIAKLREARLLDLRRLREEPEARLRSLIRPAGFFQQKARTIRAFVGWLDAAHGGSLRRMFARSAGELRSALLEVKGLGPETVDAILLYAGGKAVFVADAYTRRIRARHGVPAAGSTYAEAQEFIHQHASPQTHWCTTNFMRFWLRWVSGPAGGMRRDVATARSNRFCPDRSRRRISRWEIQNHSSYEP